MHLESQSIGFPFDGLLAGLILFGSPAAAWGVGYAVYRSFEKAEGRREAEAQLLRDQEIARDLHRVEQENHCATMQRSGDAALRALELLPAHVQSAEKHLDQAEADFAEGVFAPFWDSVETAVNALGRFDAGVATITMESSVYQQTLTKYESLPPQFPVTANAVGKLRASVPTVERLRGIVRRAQSNFHFAAIYEQRKTNRILFAGFANLAHAIDNMSARLTESIDRMRYAVDSLHDAFNESMSEVTTQLRGIEAATAGHRADAANDQDERRAREERAIEMLDNIQRRRKPR